MEKTNKCNECDTPTNYKLCYNCFQKQKNAPLDKSIKRICKLCNKPLKIIGKDRKNGKTDHFDWNTREYHKSCWKTY